MNRLKYSIEIKVKKDLIWDTLWNSYSDWASVFFEGSYIVVDQLKEGNKVLFLGPDKSGIYSIIQEHIPNELIKFKHIGNVLNGEEQAIDEVSKVWSGANEVYSIVEVEGHNRLVIEIDVMDEHLDFMNEKLPKALVKIDHMCRQSSNK